MDLDWNQLFAFAGFGVAVLGLLGTAWWRITTMIKESRAETASAAAAASAEANVVRQELAAHRLHTAEHYVTRTGLREVTDQIMGAIGGVKESVDQMRERIDRAFDKPAATRTRT